MERPHTDSVSPDSSSTQSHQDIPPRPHALSVIPEQIPSLLKTLKQWVIWLYFWKAVLGYWDKPPRDANKSGNAAKSTDPKTWATFEKALNSYKLGNLDGIGLALTQENGIVGFDLDDCRDSVTGAIAAWAWAIVRQLPTYWEISPSGTGLRGLGYGRKPGSRCRTGNFEMYTHGRYLCITGHHLEGTPTTIENVQEGIDVVYAQMFPAQEAYHSANGVSPQADDLEILDALRRFRNHAKFCRLFDDGDLSEYGGDWSAGDLALLRLMAFRTQDPEQLDRLFRMSALYRGKWESRADYRERTIAKAIAYTQERYQGASAASSNGQPGDARDSDPQESQEPQEPADDIHLTDVGNGLRLVKQFGADIRYVITWEKWLIWQGNLWGIDQGRAIEWHARQVIAGLYRWAQAKLHTLTQEISDDDALQEARAAEVAKVASILKWAHTCENGTHIDIMVKRARVNPAVQIRHEQLDADPMLLHVNNVTIDLRTGEPRTPRRSDLITKRAPVSFDPDAECPRWHAFLRRVQGHPQPHEVLSPEERSRRIERADRMITYLKRATGMSMSGDVGQQILIFLHGTGQNGKSTFLATLLALLGNYGMQAAPNFLLVRDREQHPTELTDLFGKRFVATIEIEKGKHLAEALMKMLTGGEKVRARRMREDFWEFAPTWKIWLAANDKPKVKGRDLATWRRIKLVPFEVTIPKEEADPDLGAALREELSGILNWALEGCLEWQEKGLEEPPEVTDATKAYREETDILAQFIGECCLLHRDIKTQSSVLHKAFETYTGQPISAVEFADTMRAGGYQKTTIDGRVYWRGIGLKAQASDARHRTSSGKNEE